MKVKMVCAKTLMCFCFMWWYILHEEYICPEK